ncbi:MAG: Type 1 glutamine amidotransferase-like domain-containing protein [Clostridia bacterium]|nr:Type 1 glutamine amidotransferase-like domain-containing protein [Clostridia bacterium]
MIVLCSDGLSSEKLRSYVRSRISVCKTAALVVTADSVYKEKNRHVSRCIAELKQLNLSVELFDLDKRPAQELLSFDVVEFIGGNPFYLLHAIRASQAEEALKQIAVNGVLIGWSAAAFVFGPTLELVNRYSPEMNLSGLCDLNGLGLTGIEVLPHYHKFLQRFDRFEERCAAYEAEYGVSVIRIDDGEGVMIEGDSVSICRLQEN